jgi:hypothetical protein
MAEAAEQRVSSCTADSDAAFLDNNTYGATGCERRATYKFVLYSGLVMNSSTGGVVTNRAK